MRLTLPAGAYPGKYLKVEYHLKAPLKKTRERSRSPSRNVTKSAEHGTNKTLICREKPFGLHIQEGSLTVSRVRGQAKLLGANPGDKLVSMDGVMVDAYTWKQVYQNAEVPFPIVLASLGRHSSSSIEGTNPLSHSNRSSNSSMTSPLRRRTITVCVAPFGMTCQVFKGAVIVRSVEGEAAHCGIRSGDRIETVSGVRVGPETWKDTFRSACRNLPFDMVILPYSPPGTQPSNGVMDSTSSTRFSGADVTSIGNKTSNEIKNNISQDGTLVIRFNASKPIGIELREQGKILTILRTEKNTQANGLVQPGWRLLSIDGKRVSSRREVGAAMRHHRHQGAPPVPLLFQLPQASSDRQPMLGRDQTFHTNFPIPPTADPKIGLQHTTAKSTAEGTNGGSSARSLESKTENIPANNHPLGRELKIMAEMGLGNQADNLAALRKTNGRVLWQEKLSKLRAMGFSNDRESAEALSKAAGNIEQACEMLLSGKQ
mmetsp:Transcript_14014/g.34206  ORF Transcript_14014/g.34206 Transcript_14014/m.34206 type:complete len:487 (+) Transcript_14014:2173-3633(+)